MKEIRVRRFMETRTVAVLIGLAIGLGIALHEAFLLVALLIAVGAAVVWAVEAQPSITMFAIWRSRIDICENRRRHSQHR